MPENAFKVKNEEFYDRKAKDSSECSKIGQSRVTLTPFHSKIPPVNYDSVMAKKLNESE